MADLGEWGATIGWALTGFGWFVTSYQANQREARKERRAEVDSCCKLAHEILEKARKHYSKPGDDPDMKSAAADITFSLRRLLKRVERLQQMDSSYDMKVISGQLMDSLTGADFDSVSRTVISADDVRLKAIEQDTHELMDRLELGFYASTRPLTLLGWRFVLQRG